MDTRLSPHLILRFYCLWFHLYFRSLIMSLSSKHGPILAQHIIYAYVFKNRQKKETELSNYAWDLKDKNVTNYSITLSIVKRTLVTIA